MDVVRGNPTLFMRRDEVEAAWAWVEPILAALGRVRAHRPKRYPAGTTGPIAAATLLERDGRTWQEIRPMSSPPAPPVPTTVHPVVAEVTARLVERSAASRAAYLARDPRRRRHAAPPAASSAAPTSPTASPPPSPAEKPACAAAPSPTWRS